jgi:hypothetical protein
MHGFELLQQPADTLAKRVLATLASGWRGLITTKEPKDAIPGPIGSFVLARAGHVRAIPPGEIRCAVRGILIGLALLSGSGLPAPRVLKRRVDKTIKEITRLLRTTGGRWRGAVPEEWNEAKPERGTLH